jgi:hypothetical protein
MIRAKQKPINQLKSIQRMKATHSDFIPYATATALQSMHEASTMP